MGKREELTVDLFPINRDSKTTPNKRVQFDTADLSEVKVAGTLHGETAETICTQSISLSNSSVPLLYLKVLLNGEVTARALIDSGAQRSLIHESLILQGGWSASMDATRRSSVKAIGEETGLLSSGLVKLKLSTDSFPLETTPFVVIPDEVSMINKVILGMDFIQDNKLVIDVSHRVISTVQKNGSTCDWILGSDGGCRRALLRKVACVAAADVSVEPDTSTVIPLMFSGGKAPLAEVDSAKKSDLFYYDQDTVKGSMKSLCIYSGIMNSGDMKVVVKNVEKDAKKVKKGHLSV